MLLPLVEHDGVKQHRENADEGREDGRELGQSAEIAA
jgi:hypothetical protein